MICPLMVVVTISCMVPLLFQHGNCAEIIDGREVIPHSLPHMALLKNSKGQICGGTLIHPKWVLTAAHCKKMNKVLLGVHSIKQKEKDSRQIRKVNSHVPHPSYDPTRKVNDLMLLKLDKAVKPTKTVKTLPVPNKPPKDPVAGTTCLVAGWGTKNDSGNKISDVLMSDVLMSVNVTVVDRRQCNSPEYYNRSPIITNSMICAGSVDKSRSDTCQGDSGGPLLCNDVFVGVTSFGKKCGIKTKPGVYSYLTKRHIDWIKKTIRK